MPEQTNQKIIFMRRNLVIKLTGLSASTIWRLEKIKDFPARYKLSKNIIGYKSDDIEKWINTRQLKDA
jgi:predicted DNA-binding transcriptional regulator AlpA